MNLTFLFVTQSRRLWTFVPDVLNREKNTKKITKRQQKQKQDFFYVVHETKRRKRVKNAIL